MIAVLASLEKLFLPNALISKIHKRPIDKSFFKGRKRRKPERINFVRFRGAESIKTRFVLLKGLATIIL